MKHEIIANRIQFLVNHRIFKKVEQPANSDYIICDDRFCYPNEWILNDYIFFKKLCNLEG